MVEATRQRLLSSRTKEPREISLCEGRRRAEGILIRFSSIASAETFETILLCYDQLFLFFFIISSFSMREQKLVEFCRGYRLLKTLTTFPDV
jgi:hypothetical protein